MEEVKIYTERKEQAFEITKDVERFVSESKVKNGFVTVFCPHTTAAVAINENADPSVKSDLLKALKHYDGLDYEHAEGNSSAHVKAVLAGSSQIVLVENGKLQLGVWQGVFFLEFDGPRERRFLIEAFGK